MTSGRAEGTDVQSMLECARRETGLSDFGDEWFLEPLEAWAQDLQSDRLSDFGRTFLTNLAVRDLIRRLRVLDTLERHPEILGVAIPDIVYITGLERSGTTLLHNLIARHRDARALLRWELMQPVPPPTRETHATDPRIAQVQSSVDKLKGTLLERMHWVNADDPEECPWGFIDCVGLLGQAAGFCMPTWWQYLLTRDLTPAFRNYRKVIQLLLWKNPLPEGGFLVLKAPQVAASIAAFAEVFPEARFVITDRDPFRTLTSLMVMVEAIVAPFCRENPVTGDGERDRLGLSLVSGKLRALAAFSERRPECALHVAYPELARDPAATTVGVLEALGIVDDAGLRSRADDFLAAQRAGRRARPPKKLATMGYDHDEVLGDPAVAAYCQRWGIEPERSRMTGA